MAFSVQFTTIAKRHNSTLRPSNFSREYGCVLKEGATITAPIIGLDIGITNNPAILNYAHISEFSRFYFVTDWKWEDGLWWAYLKVDVLASFKNEIGASTCYISRSALEWDNGITDTLYPAKPAAVTELIQCDRIWTASSFSNGSYVIGILGQGGVGAVNYYSLTPAQLSNLRDSLMSNTAYLGTIEEVSDDLTKALFNPFQYFVSATWFPFSPVSGSSSQIKFGWWEPEGASGNTLTTLEKHVFMDFWVVAPNRAVQQGGGYRLAKPYCYYVFFLPPFGEIELDSSIIASAMHVDPDDESADPTTYAECQADVYVDLVTGMGYLEVVCNDTVIAYREAMVGVPTQLGQITQPPGMAIGNTILSSFRPVFTDPVYETVSNVANCLSAIVNGGPKALTTGANGSITAYDFIPYVKTMYYPIVEESQLELGRPLCKTKVISTLPGYSKTYNADIEINRAFAQEQEEIKRLMDGGFFYE